MAIRTNAGLTALQSAHSAINPKVNSGVTGASTASPKYDYGHQRLQYVLNNRTEKYSDNAPPQIESSTAVGSYNNTGDNSFQAGARVDNEGNLYISRDLLGYQTPMSAEEQLKLVDKYENKKFNQQALAAGVSNLSNAFGKTGGFSTVFGSYTPR